MKYQSYVQGVLPIAGAGGISRRAAKMLTNLQAAGVQLGGEPVATAKPAAGAAAVAPAGNAANQAAPAAQRPAAALPGARAQQHGNRGDISAAAPAPSNRPGPSQPVPAGAQRGPAGTGAAASRPTGTPAPSERPGPSRPAAPPADQPGPSRLPFGAPKPGPPLPPAPLAARSRSAQPQLRPEVPRAALVAGPLPARLAGNPTLLGGRQQAGGGQWTAASALANITQAAADPTALARRLSLEFANASPPRRGRQPGGGAAPAGSAATAAEQLGEAALPWLHPEGGLPAIGELPSQEFDALVAAAMQQLPDASDSGMVTSVPATEVVGGDPAASQPAAGPSARAAPVPSLRKRPRKHTPRSGAAVGQQKQESSSQSSEKRVRVTRAQARAQPESDGEKKSKKIGSAKDRLGADALMKLHDHPYEKQPRRDEYPSDDDFCM